MTMTRFWFLLPLLAPACRAAGDAAGDRPVHAQVPPPLQVADAYAAATTISLAALPPEEEPGLHNLYRLSPYIVSGSEPHGAAAFERLAELGIKTILSVDGMSPDAATAARYGLRYVHVPIQYRSITADEMLRIAKTFRELEGPFYVHCFHGKHRGPAAAAIGRLVLDGIAREQAIAEMRQWCGTSPKYAGLYEAVATHAIPSADATGAYAFDFPSQAALGGFAAAMVEISRPYDFLEQRQKLGWTADPEQPDLDLAQEARRLADGLRRCRESVDAQMRPQDFLAWLADGEAAAASLEQALRRGPQAEPRAADRAFATLKQSCDACHASYRND